MSRSVAVACLVMAVVSAGAAYVVLRSPTEPPKPIAAAKPSDPLPPSVLAGRPRADPGASRGAPAARAAVPPSAAPPATEAKSDATARANLGTLFIDSDVPGVSVFIDRLPVGVTPITVPEVKPGPHRLNLSLPGYEPVSDTIEVAPGRRDFMFKFREVRLDARIDVVHKHRAGSCKGVLSATPRALRYETSDRDDAFSVGLMEVDSLQIDYLENHLRITLRGGKRFDFSDPGGDADHLFVFHRDVEKARDRLRRGDPPAPE